MAGEQARKLYEKLNREAEEAGYHLNADVDFVLDLMEGLITNEKRYGYWACPCRLADGVREKDLDIICPCDYRDPDLADYGACFCALYVSDDVRFGKRKLTPVPERRGQPGARAEQPNGASTPLAKSSIPVWRCKVCGYLCAVNTPPLKCPICKADRDRFERFAW
jgi:ferredoxin-thioredoxin reductase catalytic subunit